MNSPLLSAERRERILTSLHRQGKVVVSELSASLHVSIDTIRRDLRELGDSGLLQRVHGGALPALSISTRFDVRLQQPSAAKVALGKAAAQMVRDDQVIVLDGGTTTLQIAQNLPRSLRATILTNSIPIASALTDYPTVDVFLVGGQLFKQSPVTVGPEALKEFQRVRADICFLGVRSVHPEHGVSAAYRQEAEVKRAMVDCAAEVVALATVEKLGTVSPYIVAPLADLTCLVTENAAAPETLAPYRELGLTIVQA
ncbi:MAG TPA: DeoR/GlpR family DNA-binding transcription regulator [Verrucomicrobiae bacterium]|nr:DeoR/GlpR family DNA-binding transcription regulator [Verrucomicrobiae bacterium]